MQRSLTRTFSVPTAAVRGGDFSGCGTICDPLTITDDRQPARRSRTTASRRAASIRSRRRSCSRCRCRRRARALQNLTSVEEQDQGHRPVQRAARSSLRRRRPAVRARSARSTRTRCSRSARSALQETLVPGFGRTLDDQGAETLVVSHTHVFGTSLLNELRFGWMTRHGGQVSAEPRRRLRQPGRPAGRHDAIRATWAFRRSRRAGSTARSAIPPSFVYRDNQHFELYDNVHDRSRRASPEVRRLLLPPAASGPSSPTTPAARSPTPASSPATRSPTSCSAIRRRPSSGIGRGDEDGRTNWLHLYAQDDWRVREQPDASTSGCATNTTSTCTT